MGNYLKKPIIDEAVQSGRLGTINYASNTIQVSNIEFGLDLAWSPCYGRIPSDGVRGIFGNLENLVWSNFKTSEIEDYH